MGQAAEVERLLLVAGFAAGDESHGRGGIAPGERDTGVAGHGRGGGDAGDDFVLDAGGSQCGDFFHQVAEQAGVATFQADHDAAGGGQFDQPAIDLVLRPEAALPRILRAGAASEGIVWRRRIRWRTGRRVVAGGMCGSMAAEADELGRAGRQGQDAWIDQIVVEHDVGPRQALLAAQRHQARIAGSGPDDVDFGGVVLWHAIGLAGGKGSWGGSG